MPAAAAMQHLTLTIGLGAKVWDTQIEPAHDQQRTQYQHKDRHDLTDPATESGGE